jgi:hypothetical protein
MANQETTTIKGRTANGFDWTAQINLSTLDAEVEIAGESVSGCLSRADERGQQVHTIAIIYDRLPAAFRKAIPALKRGQMVNLRIPAEAVGIVRAARSAAAEAKSAKENEKKARAREFAPVGFHFTYGCDCANSASVRYPDDVPEQLWRYLDQSDANLILKHVRGDEINAVAAETGATRTPADLGSYGGWDFSAAGFERLREIARGREEAIQRKKAEHEAAVAREAERVKQLAQGREVIVVECESAPHSEDLSGAILNGPAPNGGSFLVGYRVERALWDRMKAAGAVYYGREALEDFDMFFAEPGWRYSLGAVAELIKAGFAVQIERKVFTTVEGLRGHYGKEA